ncbi:MAG: molybdopterin molybdotransferase MoeA [Alicyclobacillus macrosporangiidus]|uniref:molybdopterin molybdotransferase MoeA n=1 Tax=Alicyclobacillus macrosporangiidus TaxID=392015 RepID=UPI0026E95B94|nr:gephyrin-like molybdotransferase Glp [Alicyclobacillus macrosporangiidus]MCL6597557.1 molybdopterin molybdotransferase MoeA [Alicyclobacillus macrosporangiidus]
MDAYCTFEDAVRRVTAMGQWLPAEEVALAEAEGRVLAAPVLAAIPVPPFTRAMMDGFAVRSADAQVPPVSLRVRTTTAAGDAAAPPLRPGEAVRILTGAPLPPGADAVARFEWCDEPEPGVVTVLRRVSPGDSVQPAGDDAPAGSLLMTPGTRLGPLERALAQTFGVARVRVHRVPQVAIVVTGSELVTTPGAPLRPGQIYSCNDTLMSGLVASAGGEVAAVDVLPDHPARIRESIARHAAACDCVITTGGASAGDYDFIPGVLADLGGEMSVHKVWMRPGSPFLAARIGACTVFALSGNPAAALIQFESLVRVWFDAALGRPVSPFPATGRLAHDLHLKPVKHTRVLRARAALADGVLTVDTSVAQSSGVLSSLAASNCLVRIDEPVLPAGTPVPLRWLPGCAP